MADIFAVINFRDDMDIERKLIKPLAKALGEWRGLDWSEEHEAIELLFSEDHFNPNEPGETDSVTYTIHLNFSVDTIDLKDVRGKRLKTVSFDFSGGDALSQGWFRTLASVIRKLQKAVPPPKFYHPDTPSLGEPPWAHRAARTLRKKLLRVAAKHPELRGAVQPFLLKLR